MLHRACAVAAGMLLALALTTGTAAAYHRGSGAVADPAGLVNPMIGTSLSSPAQPVPLRCVRLKPRILVFVYE